MGFNQKNRRNDFGLDAICGFRPPETIPVIGYELPCGCYFRGRQEMVVVRLAFPDFHRLGYEPEHWRRSALEGIGDLLARKTVLHHLLL
jgi:hypothetical protein